MPPQRESHDGSVTFPRWFCVWMSILAFFLTIGVIPWARSISQDLAATRNEIVELKIQMRDGAVLQRDIEHNRESISRLDRRVEKLESQP